MGNSPPPIVMGYYPYTRNGITHAPRTILEEIGASLRVNPWYRQRALILAGDRAAATVLARYGLTVARIFDDAPRPVRDNAAHWMKHWMMLWAVREFGEALWLDWDTVAVVPPADSFWAAARLHETPKFVLIRGYQHAVVNCGVYYAPIAWADRMAQSFNLGVESPNDEHLWEAVLPRDVLNRPEYWWGDMVRYVSGMHRIAELPPQLVFAHVKDLALAEAIRLHVTKGPPHG